VTLSKTEHAIMTRLAQGPATYEELGAAAGISSDGARKTCTRGLLRVRPVVVTYAPETGPNGRDVLRITEAGREALPGAVVTERREHPNRVTVAHLKRCRGMSALDAAAYLGVSHTSVRKARRRFGGVA